MPNTVWIVMEGETRGYDQPSLHVFTNKEDAWRSAREIAVENLPDGWDDDLPEDPEAALARFDELVSDYWISVLEEPVNGKRTAGAYAALPTNELIAMEKAGDDGAGEEIARRDQERAFPVA